MTTFADLQNSVYTITNRPDLVNETAVALKKAIIKEHAAIDYPRDLASVAATLTQPNPQIYRYALDLTTAGVYPSGRKIKLVQEIPATLAAAFYTFQGYWGEIKFEELPVDNIFDAYTIEKQNYYTRLGNTLNLVAQRQLTTVGIVFYATPSLANTATYSDWMADHFDYVLYEAAAAAIFKMIGKDEEAAQYRQSLMDNRLDIIKSEIGAIG